MAERTAESIILSEGPSAALARRASLILYATFLILGLAGTILGPAIQSLTARFGIPLENGGIFPTLQFAGVTVGVVIAGRVLDRVNARYLLCGGGLLLGLGLLVISTAPSLPVALLGALLLGFGYAALDVSPNVVIATLNPSRASAALNLLNVFFGVGAILGPQFVALAIQQGNIMFAFQWAALGMLLLAIPLFTISLSVSDGRDRATRAPIRWLALAPFAIFLFFMVGAEVGFGSWIVTEMTLVTGSAIEKATLGASIYWLGVTVSRAVAPLLLRRLSDTGLLMLSVLLVGVSVIVLLLAPGVESVALVVAFACGFGNGPLFPTMMGIVNTRYTASRGTATGALIAVGTAGAAALPWVQGQIGGGVNGGMIVIVLASLVSLVTLVLMRRRF
jgi:fucose permease